MPESPHDLQANREWRNVMCTSLGVARAAIRGAVEARIIRVALAVAAIRPSVPSACAATRRGSTVARRHRPFSRTRLGPVARWSMGPRGARRAPRLVVGRRRVWYFCPAPVYPYPDPYEPPVTVAAAPSLAPSAPVPKTWYYCEALQGYYPYVPTCPVGWRAMPVNSALQPR